MRKEVKKVLESVKMLIDCYYDNYPSVDNYDEIKTPLLKYIAYYLRCQKLLYNLSEIENFILTFEDVPNLIRGRIQRVYFANTDKVLKFIDDDIDINTKKELIQNKLF